METQRLQLADFGAANAARAALDEAEQRAHLQQAVAAGRGGALATPSHMETPGGAILFWPEASSASHAAASWPAESTCVEPTEHTQQRHRPAWE